MQRREREKSMEVPVRIPSTWKVEMGKDQAHARMDYIARPCLQGGRGNNEEYIEQEGTVARQNEEEKTLMGPAKELDHGPL